MSGQQDKKPVPDQAEFDAFFPSPYSLSQYVPPKTDFAGADYPNPYKGGKWRILTIATQERYLHMAGGEFFSTGNHPVEMLLPLLHLDKAGFDIDVATVSGDPVKLEAWAFPKEDQAVKEVFEKFRPKLRQPLNLQTVWGENGFDKETPYVRQNPEQQQPGALLTEPLQIGVFVPGGHGALNDLPTSKTIGDILRWADANSRYFISLCHGPASMLAANIGKPAGSKFIYEGYKVMVFPDSLDSGANIDMGYIPGQMKWLVGEELKKLGVEIANKNMAGDTLKDRYVLTGDSPLASNNLGKLAAETLLEDVAKRA